VVRPGCRFLFWTSIGRLCTGKETPFLAIGGVDTAENVLSALLLVQKTKKIKENSFYMFLHNSFFYADTVQSFASLKLRSGFLRSVDCVAAMTHLLSEIPFR
jgi:hypothetical protein